MNNKNEEFLKFIGETTKKELRKINIDSKEKILRLFPKSYDDFNITNDNDIFIAEITTNPQTSFFRTPKTSFKAIIKGILPRISITAKSTIDATPISLKLRP